MSGADDYERLLEFLYLAPVGLIRTDRDGTILNMNPMANSTLAVVAAEMPPDNAFDALAPAVGDLRQAAGATEAGGCAVEHLDFTLPGSEPRTLSLALHVLAHNGLAFLLTDVTERIRQRRQIIRRERQLRSILETVHNHMIALLDKALTVQEFNSSLSRLGGFDETVRGRPASVFFADPQPALEELTAEAERSGWVEFEAPMVCRGGNSWWGDSVLSRIPDAEGATAGFALVTREATERRRREQQLENKAYLDPLTRLPNRRHFEEQIDAEVARAARYDSDLALLLLDIDHFKQVNDRHGHPVGDKVLQLVARRLEQTLREVDTAVRLGGEEFAVVAPETSATAAAALAERCRQAMARAPFPVADGESISITVSIGVACRSEALAKRDALYGAADGALYSAKETGRDRVVMADPPH